MRDFNDNRSSSSRGGDRPGGRSGGRPSSSGFGGSKFGGRSGSFGGGDRGGSRFGGGDSSRRFSPHSSGRPEMFDATCADCGNTCQVPFMPTGAKPVYCSSCFELRGNGEDRGGRPPRQFDRPSFQEKRPFSAPTASNQSSSSDLDAINAKLDKILKTLAYIAKQQPNNEPVIEHVEADSTAPAAPKSAARKDKAVKTEKVEKADKPKAGMTVMPLAPAEVVGSTVEA